MRQVALLAFAVVASLWANPVQAEAPVVVTGSYDVRYSARVSFADLSLADAADQRVLRDRVRAAAFQVCSDNGYLIHYCASATYQAAKPQIEAAIAEQRPGEFAASAFRIRLAGR